MRGYTLSQASLVASTSIALVLISAPLAGWVSDRIGSRRLAVIMVGQNLGMFVAPALFGEVVGAIGWSPAAAWLVPVALLGAVAGWLVRVR